MPRRRKNKLVMCEHCDEIVAVIVYEYNYYCADCALFDMAIPFKKTISIEDANLSRKVQ